MMSTGTPRPSVTCSSRPSRPAVRPRSSARSATSSRPGPDATGRSGSLDADGHPSAADAAALAVGAVIVSVVAVVGIAVVLVPKNDVAVAEGLEPGAGQAL